MTDTVDTLKQRIVGALVIISLAVIFLPMIFDEPHQQASNIIVPVPDRPSFQIKEITKPSKPEFKRIEFNLDSQKVEAVDSRASAQASQEINVDEQNSDAPEKQQKLLTTEEKKVVPTNITSSVSSSPKVSHLPIFKNVWMVQLGTFSQTDNAYQLRDQLRKDGFDGHTKQVELNGGHAIRVFTGPFVDKAQAEKIKSKLDKKYKVESRVMFFDA